MKTVQVLFQICCKACFKNWSISKYAEELLTEEERENVKFIYELSYKAINQLNSNITITFIIYNLTKQSYKHFCVKLNQYVHTF